MCLIIHRQKGQVITEEFFVDVEGRNSDGWGIMWVSGTGTGAKAKARSGMKLKEFWALYRGLEAMDVECIIHFRYATHGETNFDMCHPFPVAEGVYMMHNGGLKIPLTIPYDQKKSDTWAFAQLIVKPMLANSPNPSETIRQAWFNHVIAEVIGNGNRMVFLDKNGPVFIQTANWSKTSKGLVVSNSYAYNLDNPTRSTYTNRGVNSSRYSYLDDNYDDAMGYSGYNSGQTRLTTTKSTVVGPAVVGPGVRPSPTTEEEQKAMKATAAAATASSPSPTSVQTSSVVPAASTSGKGTVVALRPTFQHKVEEEEFLNMEEQDVFDVEAEYEQVIAFMAQDEEYAEELVYNTPDYAVKVLKYLADMF